jgi:hypothetical protein
MPATRRYKQLKMDMPSLRDHYKGIGLSFRLGHRCIEGLLQGSAADWAFCSESPAFVKYVPSGVLSKYMLWNDNVPRQISGLYNGILESAFKAGYDLSDKDEVS